MRRFLQQVSLLVRHARGRAAAFAFGAALAPLGACTDYVEPSWQQGMAAVNGGELYYEVLGSGDPLVLVHDFSLDRRMWEDQMRSFSARYRVIRYDARGFGRSSGIDLPVAGPDAGVPDAGVASAGIYSPSDDLRGLLDFLGIVRARVVGAGMGARYALDFVLANSDRATALVLSDPLIYVGLTQQAFTDALNPAKVAAQLDDFGRAKRDWFDSDLFTPARRKVAVERHLQRMLDDYSGWHFKAGPTRGESLPPTGPAHLRLADVAVPTLLLVGQFDIPDVFDSVTALQAGVRGSLRHDPLGVGHFPNLEAPDEFNSRVLQFFEAE